MLCCYHRNNLLRRGLTVVSSDVYFLTYTEAGIYTDRCSVFLGKRGHCWQGARAHRESVEDAMMNTHRLIFPEHAMGTQLGQPDVEDVMALCLTGTQV